MMMILIVDGVVMDIIEMMVDKQADLRLQHGGRRGHQGEEEGGLGAG